MTTPPDHPETIERLATAVYPSFAMLAGMELDLFTPLKDGPLTVEQLAAALEVRADKLQPLLYALVVAGLLVVDGERFSNTPEAQQFLVRGWPDYQGARHQPLRNLWNGVLKSAETIRTGSPQAKTDFSAISPERSESLARGRQTETTKAARELMARYDFPSYRRLLDVGGGAGHLSIAVTEAFPQLQATVVDLPAVTWIAQRVVEESGASHRVRVMAADVLEESLGGTYDVAVMRWFIQVLLPEQARRAITNVGQVIEPGGTLYINGYVLDNSRTSPVETVGMNLSFLNTHDQAEAFTEQEHRDWLTEAGFIDIERVSLHGGNSIIRASKPG